MLAGDLADHPESYDFDAASFATTLASFNDAGVAAVKGETHPGWVPDMEAAIAAVTAAAEKLADASEHAHQNPIDKNASGASLHGWWWWWWWWWWWCECRWVPRCAFPFCLRVAPCVCVPPP